MAQKFERREALRRLALILPAIGAGSLLVACSKKANCSDDSALSADDKRIREEAAKYVDQTMEATKRCSGCLQFVAAEPGQCGGCKVVKGPINPDGYCNLFVAKPS